MNIRFETTPIAAAPWPDPAPLAGNRLPDIDGALRPAFQASAAAVSNVERLFSGAYCVTTGQQPGLCTGPLYSIYKGLSAIVVARRLEAHLGHPVVPVYWVAGDDHDLSEANHLYLLNTAGEVQRVGLPDRDSAAPARPLYRESLGDRMAEVQETIAAARPDTEFQSEVLGWISRHYRSERDYATAFGAALAELLGPHGLVVFTPTHPAAKRAMAPRLLDVLERGQELDAALAERARVLAAEGRPVPVTVGDGAETVFLEGSLGRDRLILQDGGHLSRRSGQRWSTADLEKLISDEPERFSPNVLLRPVIEAAILPTLAYISGPGELDYIPQAKPLYASLQVPQQARIARWSARVVEARVAKVLAKYGLTADQLDSPEGQVEAEVLRDEIPGPAQQALSALHETLRVEYDRLETAAVSIDPTLGKTVQSARNAAASQLASLEKKLVGHLKKRNEIVMHQLAKARHSLFPLGRPQERVLNVVHFLMRYGFGFIDAALDEATRWYEAVEAGSGSG